MRERVKKCRWLASMINHPEGKRTLLQMADQGEADIAKLEAAQESATVQLSPTSPHA